MELLSSSEVPSWVFEDPEFARLKKSNMSDEQIKDVYLGDLKREFAIFWAGWSVASKAPAIAQKVAGVYSKAWEAAAGGAAKVEEALSTGWKSIFGTEAPANYISSISNSIFEMSQTMSKAEFAQVLSMGLQGGIMLGYFGKDLQDLVDPFGLMESEFGITLPFKGVSPILADASKESSKGLILDSQLSNQAGIVPVSSPFSVEKEELVQNTKKISTDTYSAGKVEQTMLEALRSRLFIINFRDQKTLNAAKAECDLRANLGEENPSASFELSYLSFMEVSSSLSLIGNSAPSSPELQVYDYTGFQNLLMQNYDKKSLSTLLEKYSSKTPLNLWLDAEKFAKRVLENGAGNVFTSPELISDWNSQVLSRSEDEKLTKAIEQTLKYLLWGYITSEFYDFQSTQGSANREQIDH
jgi:hypothetical protein